jgi:hypothetical protein
MELLVPKPPTPIAALSLETGPPEIAQAELTEFRIVKRPFPKDRPQRDCYGYLLKEMQATPDRPSRTKAELKKSCRRKFKVTVESFNDAWRAAIEVSGARWDQPGRRPSKKSSA